MKKQHIVLLSPFRHALFRRSAFAEIRVVSVKGTAAYKAGDQWMPLQTGTALAVGTKVSTGVHSNVVIRINNHTVTVEPLTIMKISESIEDGHQLEHEARPAARIGAAQGREGRAHQDRVQGVHAGGDLERARHRADRCVQPDLRHEGLRAERHGRRARA